MQKKYFVLSFSDEASILEVSNTMSMLKDMLPKDSFIMALPNTMYLHNFDKQTLQGFLKTATKILEDYINE